MASLCSLPLIPYMYPLNFLGSFEEGASNAGSGRATCTGKQPDQTTRQATFLPCAVVVRTWGERRCAEEERSSRWLSRSGCLRTPGLRALVGLRLVDARAASDELAAGDAAFTSVSERREEEPAP